MKVTTRRLAAMIAPAVVAVAIGGGLTSPALAFKLGMAVGGEAASNWQKAQGDVAHALATQRGWD